MANPTLEPGTYEIVRNRLATHAEDLRARLERLNSARRDVFGAIETRLLSSARITTDNNCVARDMVALVVPPLGGDRAPDDHAFESRVPLRPAEAGTTSGCVLLGYNVHIGLRGETRPEDVFAVHTVSGVGAQFARQGLQLIDDPRFVADFKQLYRFYKQTQFAKFFVRAPYLYMVFRVGKEATDIKTFKWLITDEGLKYLDNRSEHEVRYPSQHEFTWKRTHRDLHRDGAHPHIAIEDRLFVETVGGDLTIKIEDNTETGQGIYAEEVADPDQTLDDAEIFYAIVGNIILLKIRPYQEEAYRYIAYSEKTQRAMRLDVLQDACVLLPESHGLIFSSGYYLQSGEYKTFDNGLANLVFERRVAAPNGEDFLYVFYNRECGTYALLLYNLIEQRVETPIICHGYCLFEDGRLVFFKAGDEPQKHHTLQIWQTPLLREESAATTDADSLLFKIGNQEIVRAMAECHEVAALAVRDDSYADLYVDLVKKTDDVLNAYFWLSDSDAEALAEPLRQLSSAAGAAVEEYDRVVRIRRETNAQLDQTTDRLQQTVRAIGAPGKRFDQISEFVESLADLRTLRGQIVGIKELRYIDSEQVDALETEAAEHQEQLARAAVEFLLRNDALQPYNARIAKQRQAVSQIGKVADGKALEAAVDAVANELEMLVDVVSNLKIDDATKRTEIIDNISAVFSHVHQTRATLRARIKELLSVEGEAEFHSQLKLLGQGVANYLDVCETPERCDEYLTKLMVQIEELEGRFAEFDQLLVQLAEKRTEIYSTFDGKKVALTEARSRRATHLMEAAERILKGIAARIAGLEEVEQIHSYFASDLMVEKIRDIVAQLTELGDTVKVDDIQSRLKTAQDDAIRQLKDRRELYIEGENIIQLGDHRFSVNTQPLELTTVVKEDALCFHLTGTNFIEPINNELIAACRDLWNQSTVAENRGVYRAEYLAYALLQDALVVPPLGGDRAPHAQLRDSDGNLNAGRLKAVLQTAIAARPSEGYLKGVHDQDAAAILTALLNLETKLSQLRTAPAARALALVAAATWQGDAEIAQLRLRVENQGRAERAFTASRRREPTGVETHARAQLAARIRQLTQPDRQCADSAADHLLDAWLNSEPVAVSAKSAQIAKQLTEALTRKSMQTNLETAMADANAVSDRFALARVWVDAFAMDQAIALTNGELDEVAAILATDESLYQEIDARSAQTEVTGLLGDHPRIDSGRCTIDYYEFMARLGEYRQSVVPQFEQFQSLKRTLVSGRRESLRLDEFRPQVLTSFVRNQLIDQVYLPMIGDNLAKQMGVAGEAKRTDRMGLLLLISPPGYGKTTLMEYVANRLGLTFIKINGPAIGHNVTSLDPAEARHASARSEIEKLNLALEMGDNVMIYVDDIQHCHPEFLQKFISLCDAQRKIEGVFHGVSRTYDLRGRKVAVVMAGNPYTESGARFMIPDMLANRADTYNLGDVIGGAQTAFELSYLENAMTSNEVLRQVAHRNPGDVRVLVEMARRSVCPPTDTKTDSQIENAATRTGATLGTESPTWGQLEGNYSAEQVNEFVAVMRKLIRVRDVVLAVNDEYIRSAAQADEYRTEPAFRLQGSYRDMNKLTERIVPIMNDSELETAILSHYENQAQTLTSGAEANLLKLREMLDCQTSDEVTRWTAIKKTFNRNQLLGAGGDDRFAQIVAQMNALTDGLTSIGESVQTAAGQLIERRAENASATEPAVSQAQVNAALAHLASFAQALEQLNAALTTVSSEEPPVQQVQIVNRVPRVFMDIIRAQFALMQAWTAPRANENGAKKDVATLEKRLSDACQRYEKMLEKMENAK